MSVHSGASSNKNSQGIMGGHQMVAVYEYYFYPEYALKVGKLFQTVGSVQFLGLKQIQTPTNYEENKSMGTTPSQTSSARQTP